MKGLDVVLLVKVLAAFYESSVNRIFDFWVINKMHWHCDHQGHKSRFCIYLQKLLILKPTLFYHVSYPLRLISLF